MTTTSADVPVAPTALPAARAIDLTKIYGEGDTEVRALDGVTVDFARGQFTAIMGPSGSGKSTLMHCVAGLDTATSGTVQIGDTDLTTLNDKELTQLRRDRIGFVFQAFNLRADADRAGEHHAPAGHRRPEARPGVARHGHRHDRAARPAAATARASSPAGSSSASPAPAPWPAAPRSSSPTSPPATSTRAPAPRSSASCAAASTSFDQTVVMVTHDPVSAVLRRPRALPRRRQDRRRDGQPHRPTWSSSA